MLITVLNKLDRWFVDIRRIQRCISSHNPENQEALYSHFFRLRIQSFLEWRQVGGKLEKFKLRQHQIIKFLTTELHHMIGGVYFV